jgi:FKBP-type peptidyl-prolyl cis-trans isomerase
MITTAGLLVLSACGSGSSGDTAESPSTDPVTTEADADDTTDDTASTDPADDATTDEPADVDTTPTNPDKPVVEIPDEAPTELVRTVLDEGTGEPAVVGDTLIVDYVGVRTVDGVEFDNSYDREPFPITLGAGSVIQGWEDGLLGAKQGERVQLDIPSELGYGEAARSEVIRENEDLTFVIDVLALVTAADPADAPTEPGVPLSEGAEATTFDDLVVGEGDPLEPGMTALIRYVNFRGDNGVAIESNWTADPLQIPYSADQLFPGLFLGMEGMNIGGRRAITIPPDDGFGPDGNPQGGLPAGTDMIFVIELLGAY